jgi:hypothetical protein
MGHTAVATVDTMADRFEEILAELRAERAENHKLSCERRSATAAR